MEGSLSRVSILFLFALGLIGLVLWRGAADRERSSSVAPTEELSASLATEPAAMISPEPSARTAVELGPIAPHQGGWPVRSAFHALAARNQKRVTRPHIVVRLLAADRRPLPVPAPRTSTGLQVPTDVFEWPSEPRVKAFEVERQDDGGSFAGAPIDGERLDNGELRFEVEAGSSYLIQARGPGFDGVPREVEVPRGQDRTVVELRAHKIDALGTVSVRVLSGGEELGAFGWAFDVRLESRDGAVPFLETSGIGRGKPVVFRAPSGLYRVVAEGKVATGYHGTVHASRALGRGEAEIELLAGITQEIDLELDVGANLEVELSGEPSQAEREAVRAVAASSWLEDAERRAVCARLFLLHPGRRPEPVYYEGFSYEGSSAAGRHLLGLWPLGERHVSARLPTGRFTLLARLPGGRETRTEVELRPGETTRMELGF